MSALYLPAPPAPIRPVSTRTPAQHGPVDPARVSPVHLPALARVASDLEAVTAPVKVVAPTVLEPCTDCGTHGDGAMPPQTSIATVVAADTDGFVYRSEACALHLESLVAWQTRRECAVKVEVPACQGRDFFERSPRETFYAVSAHDPMTGVAATRGMWDAWQVVEVVDGFGSARVLAPVGLRDGESFDACRERAEVLAQAVAAQRAADAYEAAFAVTVALPAVTGVAA